MESLKKRTLKVLSAAETLGVIVLIIAAIALAGVRLIGLAPYCVLSGSMEPSIPTGSLIYVTQVDSSQLAQGDVITFKNPAEAVVTHRIVEIQDAGQASSVGNQLSSQSITQSFPAGSELRTFRTKGDANQSVDGALVYPQDVLGKPVACIPYAGYAASAIQSPVGVLVIAILLTLWGLSTWLPVLLFGRSGKSVRLKGQTMTNGSVASGRSGSAVVN